MAIILLNFHFVFEDAIVNLQEIAIALDV
ncbi:MAG: hypothetical protein RIR96_1561, partial [Bacteroidota bacterium]